MGSATPTSGQIQRQLLTRLGATFATDAEQRGREPCLPPAVASAPHAHRVLERQLAEGPHAAGRRVLVVRRRRRAVPAGNEARRQELPATRVRWARLRGRALRARTVERRRHPLPRRHRRRNVRVRRRIHRSVRRRCSPAHGSLRWRTGFDRVRTERPLGRLGVLRAQARVVRRHARVAGDRHTR